MDWIYPENMEVRGGGKVQRRLLEPGAYAHSVRSILLPSAYPHPLTRRPPAVLCFASSSSLRPLPQVRRYQERIVTAALYTNVFCCLPTGTGKTFIGAEG
eukprot:SAG22_NODE_1451_length_4395_cov_4.435987_5_plen_100_part_00